MQDATTEAYRLRINSYAGDDLQSSIDQHNSGANEIDVRVQELADLADWALSLPAGGDGVGWRSCEIFSIVVERSNWSYLNSAGGSSTGRGGLPTRLGSFVKAKLVD
jgi:hypothetical protein